jgi:hypothetical protein
MEDGGSACTEIKCMWFGDKNAVEGQDSAEVKHKHRCLAMVLLQFLAHQKNHMGLVAQCSVVSRGSYSPRKLTAERLSAARSASLLWNYNN